jgi:hypothetical protein
MITFPKPYADAVARLRVPSGFLIVAVFGWFSRPTATSMAIGVPVSLLGLALRVDESKVGLIAVLTQAGYGLGLFFKWATPRIEFKFFSLEMIILPTLPTPCWLNIFSLLTFLI